MSYDPECYLCPGNNRANGALNPKYQGPFAFTNDYPALIPEIKINPLTQESPLLTAIGERGVCRVVCYTPRHDRTLALMAQQDIAEIIDFWKTELRLLEKYPWISYCQLFENRGSQMGCSNPHPHCQIWASEHIPTLPALELDHQWHYYQDTGRCLLCDYTQEEMKCGNRVVYDNGSFVALVPFWAIWPYEIMILPITHASTLDELTPLETEALADTLGTVNRIYDNLFQTPFPFSMGLHHLPVRGHDAKSCHLHFHFTPPLLRSSIIRKFMVGYELMAQPQRDLTPEQAAETLRAQPLIHYLLQRGDSL